MNMLPARSRLFLIVLIVLAAAATASAPAAAAATTELTITRLASDDTTVLAEKTVDWQWMRDNLPVLGDGRTVYYNQGPVFEGAWDDVHPNETYDPWNPTEDVNIAYKDHGEFMGTDVKDLCDLVGGADDGDMITVEAADGMTKTWPAEYVYSPNLRQGPMVIAWYHGTDTGYVDESFREGMRLYFLAETTNDQGMHVWGNWDMHEAWDEDYWYYYNGQYPSASGNSVQMVDRIVVHSHADPSSGSGDGGETSSQGFTGTQWEPDLNGTADGDLAIVRTDGSAARIGSGESCAFYLNTTGLNVTGDAYLYVFGTNNTASAGDDGTGIEAVLGTRYLPVASYDVDTGDGADAAAETWRYDLAGALPGANQTLTITNRGPKATAVTIYGGVLAAPVSGGANATEWWIAAGADTVQAAPDLGVFEDDAETTVSFPGLNGTAQNVVGRIVAVSTGASGNDTMTNRVSFNDGEWFNLLSGGREAISIGGADVTPYLRQNENTATVSSVPYGEPGDFLENRLVVLTLTHLPDAGAASEPSNISPATPESTATAPIAAPASTALPGTGGETGTGSDRSFWADLLGMLGLKCGPSDLPLIGWLFQGPVPAQENATAAPEETPVLSGTETPAAAPTAEIPANAAVSIVTNPAGAMITLDGEYLGIITPSVLTAVPTGEHTLNLDLADYAPYETTFDLEADTALAVSLDPDNPNLDEDQVCLDLAAAQGVEGHSGGIFVEATDTGADIYIDGKQIDRKTPQVVTGLKQGIHRVKIRMGSTKYTPDTREVMVVADAVTPVYFDRLSNDAARTITLDDPDFDGEYFSVDGIYTGKKMPAKVTVTGINAFAGIYRDGVYLSVPISDFAEDGSTTDLEKYSSVSGSIQIVSEPAGARIFVDGFDTGRASPCRIENISPGYHRFMAVKPGYLPAETLTLVPARMEGRTIELSLESYVYGNLYVNSTPAGARIYLYGLNTGEVTPHLFSGMAIGQYDVKVVGRSDTQTVEDVLVNPYALTVCNCTLRG